jgi:hypothetical protein
LSYQPHGSDHAADVFETFLFFLDHRTDVLIALMLEYYSTSASSSPSFFLRRPDLLGNQLFPNKSLLDLHFSSLSFWIIIPAILPATMLGYIFDAL